MRGAIRIDALHQPRPLIMDIHLLATIGVMHRDTPVIAPGITRVHLRKTRPMPNTACCLASTFPFPKETRATGQLPLQNDVLIVIPITLAFPDSIGRADQSSVFVIGVGNNVLLGLPHVGLSPFGAMHLVVHRDDAIQLITQKQRTARTVIQPLNPPITIPAKAQPVVIRIADRDQYAIAKVIETRRLGQHQLVRRRTQIDRRFGQAIRDRGPRVGGQGQGSRAVFMVSPHHRIARHTKPVGQRMAPTKPQPTINFHRAGAVQPRPLKRQDPVQRAIGEGQQLLASDHRHRATVSDRFIRRSRRISFRIRSHSRHIIDRLLTDQRCALGLAAHHRHRIRNQRVTRFQRHHRHCLDRRRRTAQQHRLGDLHMGFQPRPLHLLGQQFQQRPRPPGFDVTEHTSPQSHHHAHRTQHANQQQIDQHLTGDFTPQFSHLRRREHAYPADQRR